MSWLAASLAVLGVVLVAGFAWFERARPDARIVALVASLAALAVLGRIAFAPVPNVKPTTDIVLLTGYALGGAPGFAVGALAALASNVFFGQGPWTPWQMVAWGGVGVFGALLARAAPRRGLGRWPLALACAVAGLAYGAFMNVGIWLSFTGEPRGEALAAIVARSIPFDLAHALGNIVFCLAFGPALVGALGRFRHRLEVTWRPAPALIAVALVAAALAPQAAEAQAPAASVRWLERAQNRDGGFGPAPGQASTQLHTGWAALGLAAAGRPNRRALAFTRARVRELRDLGAIERTILVIGATGGASPRSFAGRDLVAELLRQDRRDGAFGGRVNTTAFAVLALRAAGRSRRDRTVRRAAGWIARQANRDGGFNFGRRGAASGIDDTAAALQALVAGGRSRSDRTVRRAASFLARAQNVDGGFPLQPGDGSNAQSTAWAVQGLLAAGRRPERVRRRGGRDPIAYLRSLITPQGYVRYSRTSSQTPVWVTAQAIAALARRPLPIRRT